MYTVKVVSYTPVIAEKSTNNECNLKVVEKIPFDITHHFEKEI